MKRRPRSVTWFDPAEPVAQHSFWEDIPWWGWFIIGLAAGGFALGANPLLPPLGQ